MNYIIRLGAAIFILFTLTANAQQKVKSNTMVSGDYDLMKLSADTATKAFTGVIDGATEGNFSCTLFICGQAIADNNGKFPIKAYPYGLNGASSEGTLVFHQGKNGHRGSIEVYLDESGSCQMMVDFRSGLFLTLVPYHKFSIVKAKKAVTFSEGTPTASKKGYFLQGDLVSILSEKNDYCYVQYLKKATSKAWVKKTDLVL
jgi:hypothetical protein